MVEYQSGLDRVFAALADPTRRAMLGQLAQGSASVGELAAPHEMSLAGASKHLKVLEQAGLVQREVRGRRHICSLNAQPLHAGMEWLQHYRRFWESRLDALEKALKEEKDNG